MDFDHINCNLMLLDQEKYFFPDWSHDFGDSLPDDPHLLSQNGDLLPLPEESLAQFDHETLCFSSDHSLPLFPYQCHFHSDSLNKVHLDDIDLESFACSVDLVSTGNKDVILDPLPLDVSDLPLQTLEAVAGADHGASGTWNKLEKPATIEMKRPVAERPSRLNDIGFEEMKNYFYMPITKAAKEMNVGLTVLKKRCRELGIARWPHRKMKSLKSLIHNVQELGKGLCEESIRKELERLEEHRRLMEENPEIQLTERTKRLRQACFKANYNRRLMHQTPSSSIHDEAYYAGLYQT